MNDSFELHFIMFFLADYTIYGKGNTAILRPLAGRCEGHI